MIVVAPNQSAKHQALYRLAPREIADALHKFLWEINAHWSLVALPLVCQNLKEILAIAEETWGLDLTEWDMQAWPGILDWITINKRTLAEQIQGHFGSGFDDRNRHPLMGFGIERHSVYATMCNSHVDNDWKEAYRLLQAQLLLAQVVVTRHYTTMAEYESNASDDDLLSKKARPYSAAFAVRLLSKSEHVELLRELPVEKTPSEFLEALDDVQDVGDDTKRFDAIAVFFEKAFGGRKQRERETGSGGNSERRPPVDGGPTKFESLSVTFDASLDDPDDKSARAGQHSTTTRIRHAAAANADELFDVDDYPGEDEEDEENDQTDFADQAFQREPGSFQQVSAAQAMQIQMTNQLFPWAYGSLTAEEVEPLISACRDRENSFAENRMRTPKEFAVLEVVALAQVMFWTSSSLERARSLRVLGNRTANRNVDLSLIPKSKDGIAKWRIRAPLDSYRRVQEAVPTMDRDRTEFLELPDVGDGSCLVLQILREQGLHHDLLLRTKGSDPQKRRSVSVFRRPASWYRVRLRALNLMGENSDTRVTEHRLSHFMFPRIMEATGGNLSATAIITGNKLPLAKVKLFYACPSVYKLQVSYSTAALRVDREIRSLHGDDSQTQSNFIVKPTNRYIGNRICPTTSAVRAAIFRVKQELAAHARPSTDKEIIRYHNVFTLYTVWMFSYTTGIRGIKTPYVALCEVDRDGKLGTLTDKDSGCGYKARLMRFTPMLIEQMEFYEEFLSHSPLIAESKDFPCFFLDDALKPGEVRPREQIKLLNEFLPFPVNIHRRFISSELLDAGCPPEIVSAWMGHWCRGEEPWGKFSSFSHGDYQRILGEYLDPLLADLGFRSIPGYTLIRRFNEPPKRNMGEPRCRAIAKPATVTS